MDFETWYNKEKNHLPFQTKIKRFCHDQEDVAPAGQTRVGKPLQKGKKHFSMMNVGMTPSPIDQGYSAEPSDSKERDTGVSGNTAKRHFTNFNSSTIHKECILDNDSSSHILSLPCQRKTCLGTPADASFVELVLGGTTQYLDSLIQKKGWTFKSCGDHGKDHQMTSILAHSYISESPRLPKKASLNIPFIKKERESRTRAVHYAYKAQTSSSLTCNGLYLTTKETSKTCDQDKPGRSRHSTFFHSLQNTILHPPSVESDTISPNPTSRPCNPFAHLQESRKYLNTSGYRNVRHAGLKNKTTFDTFLYTTSDP